MMDCVFTLARERSCVPVALYDEIEFAFDESELEEDEEDEDEEEESSEIDLNALTVAELKEQLQSLGVRAKGRKVDIIAQLQNAKRKIKAKVPLNDLEVHRDGEFKWYMLQTANGFEHAVATAIQQNVVVSELQDQIRETFVPIMQGETSVREGSVMPSYIFIKMRMEKKIHKLVSDLQYVVNFVGADHGGRGPSGGMVGTRGFVWPRPISDAELERIRGRTRRQARRPPLARRRPLALLLFGCC